MYGDSGLLSPRRIDERNGHHYYVEEQLHRAERITMRRRAGMPLTVVEAVMDAPTAEITVRVQPSGEQVYTARSAQTFVGTRRSCRRTRLSRTLHAASRSPGPVRERYP